MSLPCQRSKMNGPVPTGFCAACAPKRRIASGDTVDSATEDRVLRKAPQATPPAASASDWRRVIFGPGIFGVNVDMVLSCSLLSRARHRGGAGDRFSRGVSVEGGDAPDRVRGPAHVDRALVEVADGRLRGC